MSRKEPHNIDAELRLLGAAMGSPHVAIIEAASIGLGQEDFFVKRHGLIFDAIQKMFEQEQVVNTLTLQHYMGSKQAWNAAVEQIVMSLPDTPPGESKQWAMLVLDQAIRRAQLQAALRLGHTAWDGEADPATSIDSVQRDLDDARTRILRMQNPELRNPARELSEHEGWFTTMGVFFLDEMLLYTSGGLHFIAGDPGSGKTSIAIAAAAHNAKHGVPTALILAEANALEVEMSLLLLLGIPGVDSHFIGNVLYNYRYRTEDNIALIEEIWDQHYKGLPISIYTTTKGTDEVIAITSAQPRGSLVITDHAYAVVPQTEMPVGIREHQAYINLFSRKLRACQRYNHIGIMLNQFKLSGREGDDRGPDAEYGGSGVRNIAESVTHLWPVDSDYSASSTGIIPMTAKNWKARARLLADKDGVPVNPVGMTKEYWLDTRHRRILRSAYGERESTYKG